MTASGTSAGSSGGAGAAGGGGGSASGDASSGQDFEPLKSCKYKYAMICSSNVNRSMEAHLRLQEKNFRVWSFGVGSQVRMPGIKRSEPSLFDFGTRYDVSLSRRDQRRTREAETGVWREFKADDLLS